MYESILQKRKFMRKFIVIASLLFAHSLSMMEKIAAALQIDALDLFDKDGLISIDKNSLRADVLERISRAVEDAFDSHSVCS